MNDPFSSTTGQAPAFHDLNLSEISGWAGTTVTTRGRDYWSSKAVSDLVLLNDGRILATVAGSTNYVTTIKRHNGKLTSTCTCPYGTTCKHAVAVLYAFLEQTRAGHVIPQASTTDNRINETTKNPDDFNALVDEEASNSRYTDGNELRAYLKALTQPELVELILNLAERFDAVGVAIDTLVRTRTAEAGPIVSEIRQQLAAIGETEYQSGHRSRYRHRQFTDSSAFDTNFDTIETCLEKLLEAGEYSSILSLTQEVFTCFNSYIPEFDEDGETSYQCAPIIDAFQEALVNVDLPTIEKLRLDWHWSKNDKYSQWEGLPDTFLNQIPPEDWSAWADECLARLPNHSADDYRYYGEVRALLTTLRRANRDADCLALLRRIAPGTGLVDELIKTLFDQAAWDELETLLLAEMVSSNPRVQLRIQGYREKFISVRLEKPDQRAVFTIRRDDFVTQPSEASYAKLVNCGRTLNLEAPTREWALAYLESGKTDQPGTMAVIPAEPSPLPVPTMTGRVQFPCASVLLDIAIAENSPAKAVKWYDLLVTVPPRMMDLHLPLDRLADCIALQYPERALTIWKQKVASNVERTSNHSYEEAGRFVEKIQTSLRQSGHAHEWEQYATQLAVIYKRKPNFMKVLNTIKALG